MKVISIMALAITAVVLAALGCYWLMWKLWLFVVPAIWPDGPVNFVHPGYWLFTGAWFLICLLGRSLFASEKS